MQAGQLPQPYCKTAHLMVDAGSVCRSTRTVDTLFGKKVRQAALSDRLKGRRRRSDPNYCQ
jgi:hypothetical protein